MGTHLKSWETVHIHTSTRTLQCLSFLQISPGLAMRGVSWQHNEDEEEQCIKTRHILLSHHSSFMCLWIGTSVSQTTWKHISGQGSLVHASHIHAHLQSSMSFYVVICSIKDKIHTTESSFEWNSLRIPQFQLLKPITCSPLNRTVSDRRRGEVGKCKPWGVKAR